MSAATNPPAKGVQASHAQASNQDRPVDAHAHIGHAHDGHAHDGPGHHHHHHHGSAGTPRRALAWALALTGTFVWVELLAGYWTGSLSLIADAGHMLSDSGALGLSLWAAHIAQRPRSSRRTYGYKRAEVLGAVLNATLLTVASVWVGVQALYRLWGDAPHVHGRGMLGVAVFGLGVNVTAAWILHRHGGGGMNVRAALLHVMSDLLGSVLAIAAAVSVLSGLPDADALASLAIAVLLLWGGLRLLREATDILMEGVPAHLDVAALERSILDTPGVRSVHDLHVWALTPEQPMLTAHVVIAPEAHGTDVAQRVGERLRERFALEHVTIQPEPSGPQLVVLRVPERPKDD